MTNFGDKIKEFTKTQIESETNTTEKHSSETVKYCEVSEYDSEKQGELNENDKEKHVSEDNTKVVENNESTEIETLTMFKQNEGEITPEYMEKIPTVEIGNKFEFVHPDVISSGTDDSFNDSLSAGVENITTSTVIKDSVNEEEGSSAEESDSDGDFEKDISVLKEKVLDIRENSDTTVPHNQPEETITVEVPLSTISQRTNSVISSEIQSHDSKITTEYEGNVLDNDERALEIEQVNPKNSPIKKRLKNNSDHGKLTLDLDLSDVSDENSDFSSSESDSENKDEPMDGGEETCNENKLTNLNEAGNTIYDKKKSENKSCSVEESKVEEPNKTSLLNSVDVEESSSADESSDTEDDFEENMNSMIIKFAADENDEIEQRSLSPCKSSTET